MSHTLLFSGQGSQYVGMTKDLVAEADIARSIALDANEILGYDLLQLMHDGPADVLMETRFTQPALFLHEAMVLAITEAHKSAHAVAGHSLGEYAAYFAAGVLTFHDALSLVALRGRLMFEAGERIPGTMAAIVGLTDEQVEDICHGLNKGSHEKTIVAANYNAPGQVVISGSRAYVRESLPLFKQAGAKIVKELTVSGAFHSPLLASASEQFTEALMATPFSDAQIPVYTNVDGRAVQASEDLRNAAARQLTAPVRWTHTLRTMERDGFTHYTEVGPGSVLQGLVKRTVSAEVMEQCSGLDTISQCQAWRVQHS